MKTESVLGEMKNLFLALGDETRLRLLNLMREDEVCVCFFTEVLGVSQPKISRHLSYLRNAKVVSARRDGKWMHYRIEEPKDMFAAQVLRNALQWLASQAEMQHDYEKLAAACRAPDAPVTIARAPKPVGFTEMRANEKPFERSEKRELETFLL